MISLSLNEATEVNLTVYRGMDSPLILTVTDTAGSATNLTGYTVRILVASAEGEATTVNGAFTISGVGSNVLTYLFTDTATADTAVYPDEGYYEVQWLDGSGLYRKLMYGAIIMVDSLAFA